MEFLRQLFHKQEKPQDPALFTGEIPVREYQVGTQSSESALDETIEAASPLAVSAEISETIPSTSEQPSEKWVASHPLTFGYATDVGMVRNRNEDAVLVFISMTLGDSVLPPYGLFIVADGMGGQSEGHRASQLACRIVARDVMRRVYTPSLKINVADAPQPILGILEDALMAANWDVHEKNPESGTTLTAALVVGDRLYLAHVGDSRAYMIRNEVSQPELLTLDHSFVQRLQDTGQITVQEAAVHPQRNILYRAIGQGDKLEVDTFSRPLPKPGCLLLCSDGLWGMVDQQQIHRLVVAAPTPQQACNELVQAALEAGAPDNVSVVVVHVE